MIPPITEPAITTRKGEGQDYFGMHRERREDFSDWLTALGANVADLVTVEYHVADEPVLRLTRHARDEQGRMLVTKSDDGPPVAMTETAEILCTIAPPEWWWPVCPQCNAVGTLRLLRTTVRCRGCRMVRLLPDEVPA